MVIITYCTIAFWRNRISATITKLYHECNSRFALFILVQYQVECYSPFCSQWVVRTMFQLFWYTLRSKGLCRVTETFFCIGILIHDVLFVLLILIWAPQKKNDDTVFSHISSKRVQIVLPVISEVINTCLMLFMSFLSCQCCSLSAALVWVFYSKRK